MPQNDFSHNKKKWTAIILVSAATGAFSAFITVRVFISSQSAESPGVFRFQPSGMMASPLRKGEIPEAIKDCQDVFDKYCKEVEPGNGRIIKCLKEHEDELNALCKPLIKKLSAHR